MKSAFFTNLLLFLFLTYSTLDATHSAALLSSTEGDPDGIIGQCVNVIKGDYCESVTDLAIIGPDTLLLQRYYNSTNYITGEGVGGWRIFPQQYIVLGKDKSKTNNPTTIETGF